MTLLTGFADAALAGTAIMPTSPAYIKERTVSLLTNIMLASNAWRLKNLSIVSRSFPFRRVVLRRMRRGKELATANPRDGGTSMPRKRGNKSNSRGSSKQKQNQNQPNVSGSKGGGFGDVVQGSHSSKKKR